MEDTAFKQFIDLIAFDQETQAHKEAIQGLATEVAALRLQAEQSEEQALTLQKKAKELQRDVDAKELEMKALDVREKEVRKKLDNAQNQKEYAALKKEIISLKTKQHEFEPVLLQVWRALEAAQASYNEQEKIYEQTVHGLQDEIAKKEEMIVQKKETLAQQLEKRVEKERGVPQEWLEKYTRMQAIVSDPVVPLKGECCGACFTMIPVQDRLALKRRVLLQCKECYRLLYDPAVIEA